VVENYTLLHKRMSDASPTFLVNVMYTGAGWSAG